MGEPAATRPRRGSSTARTVTWVGTSSRARLRFQSRLTRPFFCEVREVLVDGGQRAQAEVVGRLLDRRRVALALDVAVQEVQDLLLPARHVHDDLPGSKVGENQAKVNPSAASSRGGHAWPSARVPAGRVAGLEGPIDDGGVPGGSGRTGGGSGGGRGSGSQRVDRGKDGSAAPTPPVRDPAVVDRLGGGLGLARPGLRLAGAGLGLADAQRRPRAGLGPRPPRRPARGRGRRAPRASPSVLRRGHTRGPDSRPPGSATSRRPRRGRGPRWPRRGRGRRRGPAARPRATG